MEKTVAGVVLDLLAEQGVDTLFGIPGGAASPLYVALLERPHLQHITARHESAAAYMALGHALATEKPGVVVTTAGPGFTNALTGVASAYHEGAPVVHLAGEVPMMASGRGAMQDSSASGIDAVAMTRGFTKFSASITNPRGVGALMRRALGEAMGGRKGPVFLSMPLDVAGQRVPSPAALAGQERTTYEINHEGCAEAFRMLREAEMPLIVVGAGARDRASRRAILRLAEAVGAPVMVTPKGKGTFPDDHPLFLGGFGFGGHESVIDYLKQRPDVVLVCGSGLNDFATNGWSQLLAASYAFIQIDIDPGRIGRSYPATHGLVGPLASVIDAMLANAPPPSLRPTWRKVQPSFHPPLRSSNGSPTTYDVVQAINECCPPDSVIISDIGEHLSVALHYLRLRPSNDFVTCLGFAAVGSSIGVGIGYQIGARHRRVFVLCGDGGFSMHGAELATAVQHQVPITFIVINDSRLNMCHHGMVDLVGVKPSFSFSQVDFTAFARSLGGMGFLARDGAELSALLRREHQGPAVIDVRIDPDARLGGSQRNASLRQFQQ